ncbi:MAG TPA: acetate/propionate family kinase [bacterium]|jgi:acetate kinase|nr:acetate/propionate family kinase [bacterium]HOG37841.1 acetate/propionate family kinase [bacterium]
MYLVINSGSTSLKFKIFDEQLKKLDFGIIEKIGQDHSIIEFKNLKETKDVSSHKQALVIVKNYLDAKKIIVTKMIHRIVHGGDKFQAPVKLNSKTIKEISKYNSLAPLHNPINLKTAEHSLNLWKNINHVGVFDTMFFKTLPEKVYSYPINYDIGKKYGIRKFGFHGFSHYGMLQEVSKKLNKKVNNLNIITCHLGGGASICAIKNGKAIEISMGFSPSSGVMMMTRSGTIDHEIIFYLLGCGLKTQEIKDILNYTSGLFGISKIRDLRDIMILCGYKIPGYVSHLKMNKNLKKNAQLALNMFIYSIQRQISSYITLFDKIDAIVFSGGIGERNKDIRNLILKDLKILKNIPSIVVKCDEEKYMLMLSK